MNKRLFQDVEPLCYSKSLEFDNEKTCRYYSENNSNKPGFLGLWNFNKNHLSPVEVAGPGAGGGINSGGGGWKPGGGGGCAE